MKRCSVFLLIALLLQGVGTVNAQTPKGNLPVIDFSKDYPQKKLILEEVADIEYVPLETTDDILLGESSVLSAVTDNYILVHEARLGDVFLFNRKTGKIHSYFNHKGQSGQEYNWIKNGTILDEKAGEIYVCSQNIQVYSLNGDYKRTLKINGFANDMKILNFDDQALLIYDDVIIDPTKKSKTKNDPYRLISKKDGSDLSILPLHFPKRYSNTIAQEYGDGGWRPFQFYYTHNVHNGRDLIIADISSDTLYNLSSPQKLTPLLTRKPSIQSGDMKTIWTPFLTTDKFILLGTLLLDFNSKGGKMPQYMYDFKTGDVSKVTILDKEYDTKSWSQGKWAPEATPAIGKNKSAEFIQPSKVIEARNANRLKGNGQSATKTLTEEDNPVVRILTFK